MQKTVYQYTISTSPLFEGSHSTFHKIVNEDSSNDIQLIAKCISKNIGNCIVDGIKHEHENAKIYSKSNSTTILVDSKFTTTNIYNIYEFYDSLSLENYLKKNTLQTMQIQDKLDLSKWIIKALNSLHENKALHCNLNPSHILINTIQKQVKFCGNTSIYNFQSDLPQIYYSKPPYNPPGNPEFYDVKSDIFSLGIILYQIFSNETIDDNFNISKQKIDEMKNTSPEIQELINMCINKNPKERPCSNELLLSKAFQVVRTDNSIYDITSQFNNLQTLEEPNKSKIKIWYTLDPFVETGAFYGKGAYSIVKQIRHKNRGETYALKMIDLNLMKNSQENELIFQEIEMLKNTTECSFIVKLIDYFYYDKFFCIMLEDCNAGDLKKYMDRLKLAKQSLTYDEIYLIAWSVAEGLYFLHEKKKIIHRDIKHMNILLKKNDINVITEAKICDLNLSMQLKNDENTFSSVCGTLPFMAPEMIAKGNYKNVEMNKKVDTYAHGAFLAYIAFKVIPIKSYQNDNIQINQGYNKLPNYEIKFPPLSKNLFPELCDLIEKCIEIDADKRLDFRNVLSHDYFNRYKLEPFPNKFNINLEKFGKIIEHKSGGFLEENGKFWVKFYNEDYSMQDMSKNIKREIQFLMRCKSTPHIVQLIDFGLYNKEKGLIEIFEYCNGENLFNLSDKRANNKLPKIFQMEEIKIVAKCLLEFLENLHSKNYLHRAINPKHVLAILNKETNKIQEAVVCGFGYSKTTLLNEFSSLSYSELDDDILYVDINALERNFYTIESDIWSVGMVIYFMIEGNSFIKSRKEIPILFKKRSFQLPKNIDKEIEMILKFCTKSWIQNEFSSMSIHDFLTKTDVFKPLYL